MANDFRKRGSLSKWKSHRAGVSKAALPLPAQDGILAAAGDGFSMAGTSYMGSIGIPVAGTGNMLTKQQKFRTNWGNLPLDRLFRTVRWMAEANWYGSWVTDLKQAFYSMGATFATPELRTWAGIEHGAEMNTEAANYPWMDVVDDAFSEYVITENVVAVWRVNDGKKDLPHIRIMDAESVKYSVEYGIEKIIIQNDRVKMSDDEYIQYCAVVGADAANAMREGKPHTIIKGGDGDWDFEFIGKGKRGCMHRPSMTGILDDLDYIELHKVADWNGAWKRKDVLTIAKKGYALKSGAASGRPVGNATRKQLTTLSEGISQKSGTATIAVNHDTEIDYLTLSAEFFGENIPKESMRRLINWGGFAAMMLMDGFTQANGVSPYMLSQLRAESLKAREKVGRFLERIFNNPSFLGGVKPPERITCRFNEGILYNLTDLIELLRFEHGQGITSTQTMREILGRGIEFESDRINEGHSDRQSYTPVFEAKQGLLPGIFPDLERAAATPAGDGDENKGGRPRKE